MGKIKRKLKTMVENEPALPTTPTSGAKRKTPAKDSGTPSKRGKATPKGSPLKGKPVMDPPEEHEDDEDPVKKEEDDEDDFGGAGDFEF